MKEYDVTDLFEAGTAGEMIREKPEPWIDETSGPMGPPPQALDEEE